MSRETDLAALKAMKDEMVEIYTLNDKCQSLDSRCKALKKQAESPDPFKFQRKPASNEKNMVADFERRWDERHKDENKYRKVIIAVYVAIVILLTAFVCFDIYFEKNILINLTAIKASFNGLEDGAWQLYVYQVLTSAAMIYIPIRITGEW